MDRSFSGWQVAGFVFTSVTGTLLHFLFDLAGGNLVNESIWEHMKLIFFPMALFGAVEYRFAGKQTEGFWCVKLRGILLALVIIPVLYYTYTGALGVSADWFNIAIFFIAAGAAYRWETGAVDRPCRMSSGAAVGLIILIGILFGVFTFWPPRIPLFRDPVTGSYGYI